MALPFHEFGTHDGHNPEIIYWILNKQEGLPSSRLLTYNELDLLLRRTGVSARQTRLNALACPRRIYMSPELVWERLRRRNSQQLDFHTEEILKHDFFHGVPELSIASTVLFYMRNDARDLHIFTRPDYERIPRLAASDVKMPPGPFYVNQPRMQGPDAASRREPCPLPHVYLPGWEGARPQQAVRSAREWERGAELAEGRFWMRRMPWLPHEDRMPLLQDQITNLGFPSAACFAVFVHSAEVKAAFRELWRDSALGRHRHLHDNDADSDSDSDNDSQQTEMLATCGYEARPISLRILYARTLGDGRSEYEARRPNKRGWKLECHLARFCLAIEKICHAFLMPPLCGQIPLRFGRHCSERVCWAGVELARVLRRMQKGSRRGERYLDVNSDHPPRQLRLIRIP